MKTLKTILIKEFRQFFSNSFLPRLCLFFPLMIMLLMPLVANMEVKNVGVVIVDNDHQGFSRKMADNVNFSEYLTLVGVAPTYQSALETVQDGFADVILEIPSGFSRSLMEGRPMTLNLSANAVNTIKGTLGMQYLQNIIMMQAAKEAPQIAMMPEVEVSTLNFFNPTLNYKYFMIPALMIMLLIMICGFLPALNIVGEKERGTIEQINVSPVGHLTFTFGKVIPYWIIGFVVLAIAMTVAWLVYGLTPAGGLLPILVVSAIFIMVMSALGMMIANGSDSMQQVMFVMFFFIICFILLSGLLTPVSSMPEWAQTLTYFLPPRYFIDVMRATYLKGTPISDMLPEYGALTAFAVLFMSAAILTYRKRS